MSNLSRSDFFPTIPFADIVEDASLIIGILGQPNGTILHLRNLEEICEPTRVVQFYFQIALIPALIIVAAFSFTQTRQNLLRDVCYGRPALAYPMDIFTKKSRLSYSCAFGSTVFLVYKVIFERLYAFEVKGDSYERSLAAIASMLIYGFDYLPIFICITVGTVFGFGVGSIYVWCMGILALYNIIHCDIDAIDRLIMVGKSLPQLICLLYLCVRLPWKFITACLEKHFSVGSMETYVEKESAAYVKQTYYGRHVVKLLERPQNNRAQTSGIARLCSFLYKWESDFHYSSRLITTQIVGAMVLYMVVFECIAYFVSLFDVWIRTLHHQLNIAEGLSVVDPSGDMQRVASAIETAIDVLYVFRVAMLVSLVLAAVLGFLSVAASFPCYRKCLTELFRGDYRRVSKGGLQTANPTFVAGCMRYAGYQVGYIAWGYVVQALVLGVISLIISILYVMFKHGMTDWLQNLVLSGWPVALIGIAVSLSQTLSARYTFLQEQGDTLSLTNRRVFFIATYFMFFYNIFMGIFSCLMRIIYSLVFGLYLLPRLDHSVLPPVFRFQDPGHQAFVGFLRLESQHSHPVVLACCHLMLADIVCKKASASPHNSCSSLHKDESAGLEMTHYETFTAQTEELKRKKKLNRFRWHLGYTLLTNPSIRLLRKGYSQAHAKAEALGMRMPVSDITLTADADAIKEQTKEFLKKIEEEQHARWKKCCNKDKTVQNDENNQETSALQENIDGDQKSNLGDEEEGMGDIACVKILANEQETINPVQRSSCVPKKGDTSVVDEFSDELYGINETLDARVVANDTSVDQSVKRLNNPTLIQVRL